MRGEVISMVNKNIQDAHICHKDAVPSRANETLVYITDLLGELQTIARIGGLKSLSDDIQLVLVKHMSGQSIL